MQDIDDSSIAGVAIIEWLSLWQDSHDFIMGAPVLRAWPDGQPLLEQESILVQAFDLIKAEHAEAQESNGNKKRS